MITLLPDIPNIECPPRIREIGEGGYDCSVGEIAIDLANNYLYDIKRQHVIPPYDWQQDVVRCWLSEKPDGKYAFRTCGLVVPRQNGKTKGIVVTRILAGLLLKGESIQFSAHNTKTTNEMFEIFLAIFGDNRTDDEPLFPELHDLVLKENFKNGHEEIILKKQYYNGVPFGGGRLEIVSRKQARTRGNTIDVYIIDEAQYLTDNQADALIPAKSAAPNGNPQIIYLGTPPNEDDCFAEVFGRRRKAAFSHVEGCCWHEWSVAEVPEDINDEKIWYATNPSLGKSLLIDSVRDEVHDLGPRGFAIERLCYWPEELNIEAIRQEDWQAVSIDDAGNWIKQADTEKAAIGVKFSPDGAEACASMAKIDKQGTVYSQLIWEGEGVGGMQDLIDLLLEQRNKVAYVAIDGRTGAGELFERLTARGTEKKLPKKAVHLMRTPDMTTATTMVVNGLKEKTLYHFKNETLDRSARKAEKRKIGQDGSGFGGDSCALESFGIAVWAVRTTRRRNRTQQ